MVSSVRHKLLLLLRGLFAALLLLPVSSVAQDIHVTARVDSNTILIGDWLNIYIEVERPGNISIGQPQFPDSLEGFEVVKMDPPSTTPSNDRFVDKAILTVTAFDSGMHIFPSVIIPYRVNGDTALHTVLTTPIPVTVYGIMVDTTLGIKDIKPPLSLPLTFAEMLPYIIGVILLGVIGWLVYYIMRKRKKGESIIPQAPPRPAHEVALESLRTVESEHLWQRGKVKEYHSSVTEIIRQYIERRFAVMALEQTSEEILSSDQISALGTEPRSDLKTMLVRADLVKFAKFQPTPQENEASYASAVSFVQSTIEKAPEPVADPVNQEVSA